MSRFMNKRFDTLEAYTPGEQPKDKQYIKLNTNESPYPPSPEVLDCITKDKMGALRLYSDPEGTALKEELATFYDLRKENVFISNGSDDILNFAFMAFAGGEIKASFPDVTYSFYPVFADLHGVTCDVKPLCEDFTIAVDDYKTNEHFVIITNPNAPTGIALSREEIREILLANPDRVVLVDEAYVDFGAESSCSLVKEFPNLLVVMTYSKSRSLAGARLGFALGDEALIADLETLKFSTNPYNVNRLTMEIGRAAIRSHAYFAQCSENIMKTREETVQALQAMGFEVLPSKANFVFIRKDGLDGGYLYETLKDRGILIRHFSKPALAEFNRVTIGTKEEMDAFLKAVRQIIQETEAST